MIKFKKYGPSKHDPSRYFGILVDWHPKYKGIDIYIGKHVFVFFKGYKK